MNGANELKEDNLRREQGKKLLIEMYEQELTEHTEGRTKTFGYYHSLIVLVTSGLFIHLTQNITKNSTPLMLSYCLLAVSLVLDIVTFKLALFFTDKIIYEATEKKYALLLEGEDEWTKLIDKGGIRESFGWKISKVLDLLSTLALFAAIGMTIYVTITEK